MIGIDIIYICRLNMNCREMKIYPRPNKWTIGSFIYIYILLFSQSTALNNSSSLNCVIILCILIGWDAESRRGPDEAADQYQQFTSRGEQRKENVVIQIV